MGLRASLVVLAAAVAFSTAAVADRDDRSAFRFKTVASGAQEIQPPGGVLTDTSATLKLDFAEDLSSLRFKLRVFDGEKITQAHLHCARAGVNGPVVAFLFNVAPVGGPGGIDVDGLLARGRLGNLDIEPVDFAANPNCGVAINNIASLFAAVLDGLIYLNVHAEANPAGEVRGQVFALGASDDDRDDFDD
ncbi:MAG: CHRD domain-containing protein [Kiloniellales bacterium]|nr:CHRD domain-containing protein [Kiloniellales bacterium]